MKVQQGDDLGSMACLTSHHVADGWCGSRIGRAALMWKGGPFGLGFCNSLELMFYYNKRGVLIKISSQASE
jgi:hypothetical protein